MPQYRLSAFLLCAVLALAGCNSDSLNFSALSQGSSPQTDKDSQLKTASIASPNLQPGEKIRVTVFGEDRLSGEYEIDPGGFVSLPLAGTLKAAGLSKAELEKALTQKFRGEYLRNPKVTVDVTSFRPFYILGEVSKPGEYAFKSGLNVMTAVALAGGPTYRASRSYVMIQRTAESEFKEYPLSPSISIAPGDLIRVPERFF